MVITVGASIDIFNRCQTADSNMKENIRRCSECHKRKSIDEFQNAGHGFRWGICKACVSTQKKIKYRERVEFEKRYPRPKLDKKFNCPVCKRPSWPRSNRQVTLDHDHKTGEIRGWICIKCNVGIGRLREDIPTLLRAIKWIISSEKNAKPDESDLIDAVLRHSGNYDGLDTIDAVRRYSCDYANQFGVENPVFTTINASEVQLKRMVKALKYSLFVTRKKMTSAEYDAAAVLIPDGARS